MTNEHENHTPATISALKAALSETLLIPGQDPALLARQAELLDQLFTTILDRKISDNIDDGYKAGSVQNWLMFALRVQKQCVDTVKARAAAEYMQTLSAPRPFNQIGNHPPPPENSKTD